MGQSAASSRYHRLPSCVDHSLTSSSDCESTFDCERSSWSEGSLLPEGKDCPYRLRGREKLQEVALGYHASSESLEWPSFEVTETLEYPDFVSVQDWSVNVSFWCLV